MCDETRSENESGFRLSGLDLDCWGRDLRPFTVDCEAPGLLAFDKWGLGGASSVAALEYAVMRLVSLLL